VTLKAVSEKGLRERFLRAILTHPDLLDHHIFLPVNSLGSKAGYWMASARTCNPLSWYLLVITT
jgi:hypothetical protein